MWGLAAAWTASHAYPTAMPLDRSGAIAATTLAGTWWAVWVVTRRNHDKTILIRTLADAIPAQRRAARLSLARTLPMSRVP